LSSEPVDLRVFCTPFAIINTAVKTKTTKAMPIIVIAVVSRREIELRTIYLSGNCMLKGFFRMIHHRGHREHRENGFRGLAEKNMAAWSG